MSTELTKASANARESFEVMERINNAAEADAQVVSNMLSTNKADCVRVNNVLLEQIRIHESMGLTLTSKMDTLESVLSVYKRAAIRFEIGIRNALFDDERNGTYYASERLKILSFENQNKLKAVKLVYNAANEARMKIAQRFLELKDSATNLMARQGAVHLKARHSMDASDIVINHTLNSMWEVERAYDPPNAEQRFYLLKDLRNHLASSIAKFAIVEPELRKLRDQSQAAADSALLSTKEALELYDRHISILGKTADTYRVGSVSNSAEVRRLD